MACDVSTPEGFEEYMGGIFEDTTGDLDVTHVISVVGFGEENGVKYWIGRNSWGSWWGESGFFRVVRGINNIAIESFCAYAVPTDTWTTPVKHTTTEIERSDPLNDFKNSDYSLDNS
jgi:cathepsin X